MSVKGEIRIAATGDDPCNGFIKSGNRSAGIGSQLLYYVEELLRQRQAGKVFLTVAEFNGQAKRLYERLGYQEVGRIPGLFHAGHNEQLLMKKLDERP